MRTIQSIFREIESVPDFIGHRITSVNYRNGYGDTPLHIVSGWGDCEAIQILVDAGADINSRGETGFTALHCAAEQNRPEAIRLLSSLGAEVVDDEDGNTPLVLAALLKNTDAMEAFARCI